MLNIFISNFQQYSVEKFVENAIDFFRKSGII